MNKMELVAEVAEKAELSKKDAEAAVSAAIDVITEALRKGDKVQLVGFEEPRRAHGPQPPDQGAHPHPRFQGPGV